MLQQKSINTKNYSNITINKFNNIIKSCMLKTTKKKLKKKNNKI